jgi:hypothetical protein
MIAVVQLENFQKLAIFAAVFGIKTCSAACAPVAVCPAEVAVNGDIILNAAAYLAATGHDELQVFGL